MNSSQQLKIWFYLFYKNFISVITSPFIPFFSERLYNDLCLFSGGPESVHLVDFPESKLNLISEELERKMLYAQKISSLVHSIRKKERLRVRQPLSTIIIPVDSVKKEKEIMAVSEIIFLFFDINSDFNFVVLINQDSNG